MFHQRPKGMSRFREGPLLVAGNQTHIVIIKMQWILILITYCKTQAEESPETLALTRTSSTFQEVLSMWPVSPIIVHRLFHAWGIVLLYSVNPPYKMISSNIIIYWRSVCWQHFDGETIGGRFEFFDLQAKTRLLDQYLQRMYHACTATFTKYIIEIFYNITHKTWT